MKKIFLMAIAALLFAAPAAQAQKVNRESLVAALEKSDAEILDAKKNVKAATWLKRAQTIFAAIAAPVGTSKDGNPSIYAEMPINMLSVAFGNPKSIEDVTLASGPAHAYKYNWVTVYEQNGVVSCWEQKKQVRPDLYKQLTEALNKAYELDPKMAPKVMAELKKAINFFTEEGQMLFACGSYEKASKSFMKAYRLQQSPAFSGTVNYDLIYNAAYSSVMEGSVNTANTEAFTRAEKLFVQALKDGYTDDMGRCYYYLFHSRFGQLPQLEGEARAAMLLAAKEALVEGVAKYPTNENMIRSLVGLYMQEPTAGDPSELINMIKAAIERDPQSVQMWASLSLACYQMKDYEGAIAAAEKAAELAPNNFESYYRLGVFYTEKGNSLNERLNGYYPTQAEYDADLALRSEAYREALPWFEKAHEVDPANRSTVEYLKQLYFILRDEPGMMDKYNKYHELYMNR